MTEKVIVSFAGEQMDLGEDNITEVTSVALCYFRNGKYFILYDEENPEEGESVRNTIKLSSEQVEVIRHGDRKVHMIFAEGKQHVAAYNTPMGIMMMDMYTDQINYEETEDRIQVEILYSLSMNEVFISKCRMLINVYAEGNKDFHL